MLLLFLAGLYAGLLPLGFGIWLVRLVRAGLKLTANAPPPMLLVWLGGLALLTALLEMASLLGPVHTVAHLLAVAGGASGLAQPAGRLALRQVAGRVRRWQPLTRAVAGLLILYALFIGAMPSVNFDTGVYHAQSLRWLEEVGIVPGLANADIHIGYNPAWFVPEALFGWGRYLGSPLQVLNGLLFVLVGCYCLGGVDRLLRGRRQLADLLCLLLLPLLFQCSLDIASLSPDLAATLLLIVVLLQVAARPLAPAGRPLTITQALLVVVCVFCCTVKLSALPILLLPAWWLVRARAALSWRLVGELVIIGLAVAGPWVARNIVLSGYPFYPAPVLALPVSWRFPAAELAAHSAYIRAFARVGGVFANAEALRQPQPWRDWLPIWWEGLRLDAKLILLGIVGLLPPSLLLGWQQYRRSKLPAATQLGLAWGLATTGAVFWFLLAPSIRFGYGFLLPCLALVLLPGLWAARRWSRALAVGGSLTLFVLAVGYPLRMQLSYCDLSSTLSAAEYSQLLHKLPAASQAVLRAYYSRVQPARVSTSPRPPRQLQYKLRLLLPMTGALHQGGFDGSGRSLFNWSQRLLVPASYPVVAVQPLRLGRLLVVRSLHRTQRNWYAPYPFVLRPLLCQANGAQLRAGFRARPSGNAQNWNDWYAMGQW